MAELDEAMVGQSDVETVVANLVRLLEKHEVPHDRVMAILEHCTLDDGLVDLDEFHDSCLHAIHELHAAQPLHTIDEDEHQDGDERPLTQDEQDEQDITDMIEMMEQHNLPHDQVMAIVESCEMEDGTVDVDHFKACYREALGLAPGQQIHLPHEHHHAEPDEASVHDIWGRQPNSDGQPHMADVDFVESTQRHRAAHQAHLVDEDFFGDVGHEHYDEHHDADLAAIQTRMDELQMTPEQRDELINNMKDDQGNVDPAHLMAELDHWKPPSLPSVGFDTWRIGGFF